MQKPLKYNLNNWVDGMKLSSAQFINTDLFFLDYVRDSTSVGINKFNYGLLPSIVGDKHLFDIQISFKATNYLEVNVNFCNAICSDGCRIDIRNGANGTGLNEFLDANSIAIGVHYIVLQVNLFKRIPTGDPDPNESPIRYPYIDKEYQVSIVSESELINRQMNDFLLPIGKLTCDGHNVILDESYIMPSSTLHSHPSLVSAHNRLYTQLLELEKAAFKIMEKTAVQSKITALGINIRYMSEKLLDFLSSNTFRYRSILSNESPIYLVEFFSNLSHSFFTALRNVSGLEREEMMKYFYEWKDVTPSNFEERLSEVIEHRYNHLEIQKSIILLENLMGVLVSLWNKLSTLEYIGQRKENIVVAEQKVIQEVQTKRTWSILD